MAKGKKGKKADVGASHENDNEEDTQDFLAALQRASMEDHGGNTEENEQMNNAEGDDNGEGVDDERGSHGGKKSEKKLPKKVLEAQKARASAAAEEAKRERERQIAEELQQQGKSNDADDGIQSGDVTDSDDHASGNTTDDEDGMPICYPVKVLYCPNCTFPVDMCEYGGMYEERCKGWLVSQAEEGVREARHALKTATDVILKKRKRKNLTEVERLHNKLTKGGRREINKEVHFTVVHRVGKKFTTQVKGLDLFGFVLKDVCKDFKRVLSTGASVTEHAGTMSLIEVQGDVVESLVDILTKKMNLPKNKLFLVDKDKKTCLGDVNMVMLDTKPKKKVVVKKEPIICPQQAPDFVTGNTVKKEAMVVEVCESSDDDDNNDTQTTEEVKRGPKPTSRRSGPSKRGTKNLL